MELYENRTKTKCIHTDATVQDSVKKVLTLSDPEGGGGHFVVFQLVFVYN